MFNQFTGEDIIRNPPGISGISECYSNECSVAFLQLMKLVVEKLTLNSRLLIQIFWYFAILRIYKMSSEKKLCARVKLIENKWKSFYAIWHLNSKTRLNVVFKTRRSILPVFCYDLFIIALARTAPQKDFRCEPCLIWSTVLNQLNMGRLIT